MISREDITGLFLALLKRKPESEDTFKRFEKMTDIEFAVRAIINAPEYNLQLRPGPLWQITSTFDAVGTMLNHEHTDRKAVTGHRVNYIGIAVNVDQFMPSLKLDNIVEPPPLPANWHADIAEFAAVLRSVEHAGREFSMVELGCGWGCWMNISGAAARRLGKTVQLIGVEGDEGHVAFAHESMATNGFVPQEFVVHHGIAAAKEGVAFFPRQGRSGVSWGLEPVFHADDATSEKLRKSGDFDELQMLSLKEIIGNRLQLDLLHIDIQGGEVDFIRNSLEVLNEKVAHIVIGTHSRVIDGALISILQGDGNWELEIERPCIFSTAGGVLTTQIDGLQGWRNKRLKLTAN